MDGSFSPFSRQAQQGFVAEEGTELLRAIVSADKPRELLKPGSVSAGQKDPLSCRAFRDSCLFTSVIQTLVNRVSFRTDWIVQLQGFAFDHLNEHRLAEGIGQMICAAQ